MANACVSWNGCGRILLNLHGLYSLRDGRIIGKKRADLAGGSVMDPIQDVASSACSGVAVVLLASVDYGTAGGTRVDGAEATGGRTKSPIAAMVSMACWATTGMLCRKFYQSRIVNIL